MHALGGTLARTHHRRLNDARLRIQRALDVIGKDVQSVRRHDHLYLAAANEQPPAGVLLADISSVQPTGLVYSSAGCLAEARRGSDASGGGRAIGSGFVVTRRHILTAHQDLAILRNLDLDA